ncbi:MAG: hypothetical protein JWL76_912 [Thermoleophilia bacterium]|nr:hypothetical protein [Thermoleophilia bacterium]
MNTIVPAASRVVAAPAVPAWPSRDWSTWAPTHDHFMAERPMELMQAAPIAPNAQAVAQADFAYGGNYMAHGSLDVFTGATFGTFDDRAGAFAAAQALKGVHGIVGVFRDQDQFQVRELLVSGTSHRGPGDDYRDERPAPRARPTKLIQLRDVGTPNGSWGHGDYRTLSALRFVDADLLGFVRGTDQVAR